ncbi:MAG: N-acetyltransferase [Pseudomonadota bacterium]
MTDVTLRPERPGEGPALHALTDAAFAGKAFADGTEGAIIGALRDAGDLVLSLVADAGEGPIGHVALSPAWIAGQSGWLGLGPLSVAPAHQQRGIGSKLMGDAISFARTREAKGIVLLGDPAYYRRFGFVADCGLTFLDVPTAYVQALSFDAAVPKGEITFAPALQAAG